MTTENSRLNVSERFVKISSRIPYPEDLLLGSDVTITVNNHQFLGNVVKEETEDNQDSTVNKIYKIKFLAE